MDRQDGYHMLICLLLESVSLHKLGVLEKPGGAAKEPDTQRLTVCVEGEKGEERHDGLWLPQCSAQ